ncbi:hypothetical protein COU05_02980 [bacterium (Candidatus Gribaldobacteria) CG10_big_fil_rev_8_21_14_0_10_37_21]|uniref:DUF5675 domain-containing protein n=1 Tax=bacterium (Candidatus Gribaldobacteria) CG10_big_fil_rev_8_21_14_0_10_37_21 TaxID=2014275 RepID=A0A2H0UW34_9BACT|nr:MAG: hypothetical protein COU05_02980 [bacterium (Candidatus Gribaldobacteria) CG10_big_fil_rev_8_21_14_0_10_37_21]
MSYESKTKPSFKKKFFLFFLFFLLFLLPTTNYLLLTNCFALEGDYPKIGALTIEQVTKKTVDPTHLMKFASNWVIAIAVLMIFVNIIYAGIAYVLSSGKPNSVLKARTRIKNSFVGLFIVAFSYLILLTLNPQLSIFQLERKSVPVGVLLLSEQGYTHLKEGADVLDLLSEEEVYPLTHDISDASGVLGDLAVQAWAGAGGLVPTLPTGSQTATAAIVNFSKTPLYAIVFWGEMGDDSRVVFYPKANFEKNKDQAENKPVYFDKRGQVNEQGEVISGKQAQTVNVGGLVVPVVVISTVLGDGFFKSEVDFKTASLTTYQSFSAKEKESTETAKRLVLHPPLSIALKVYSPGIYLYSLDNEELYLNQSAPDLRDYNFDQQAYSIRVQNTKRLLSGSLNKTILGGKYFAVLFSDFRYTGSSKVFFPKIQAEGSGDTVALVDSKGVPLSNKCDHQGCKNVNEVLFTGTVSNQTLDPRVALPSVQEVYQKAMTDIKYKELNPKGNAPENKAINIFPNKKSQDPVYEPSIERYGELASVSSVRIFQYEDDYSACSKIVLCTQEGGSKNPDSKCLVYLDPNSSEFKEQKLVENQVEYPMPLYEPINLPQEAYVFGGINNLSGYYIFNLVSFSDSIKSIEIEPTDGKCLVGLFSNVLKFDNANNFKSWDNETTGVSNFFTQTTLTLTQSSEIGKCGRAGGILKNQPCASAVVAFPIEPVVITNVAGYGGAYTGSVGVGEASITIRRTGCSSSRTEGSLTLETTQGLVGSATLELPWKNNDNSESPTGPSAIPSGSYTGFMRYDAHDGHNNVVRRIQLNSVPNRGGIQIHSGANVGDTEGCILVTEAGKEEDIEKAVIAAGAQKNIKISIINECGSW